MQINDVYGCYTIVSLAKEKTSKSGRKRIFFTCKCKCGNIKDVSKDNIQNNKSNCIKCLNISKRKIRYGDKYFNLIFISYDKTKNNNSKINVRCDCGKELKIVSSRWGKNKSCGCYRKNQGKSHWNYNGMNYISGNHLWAFRNNAKKRNLEFSVTPEFLDELFQKQNYLCRLSGLPIEFNIKTRTASLDRIDSSKGYTKDNIQWVHKDINSMKSNRNEKDFLLLCETITDFQRNKI